MAHQQWRATRRTAVTTAIGLAWAASAHAQSNVTLYGTLDADLMYTSRSLNAAGKDGGKLFGVEDSGWSPSNFGLSGTEDLGGGVHAIFDLESGINVANGRFNDSNGNLFGRKAWLGLDSKYGTVTMGLQFSPFITAIQALDPRGVLMFGSSIVTYVDYVVLSGLFVPNSIKYTSPRIDGLKTSVMLSLGNAPGFNNGRAYSASLDYSFGGLLLDAAIYDSNAGSATVTPVPSTGQFEGRVIGASYNFGPVIAKASFTNYKVAGSFNANVYQGGLAYFVMSPLELNASVQYSSDRDDASNHSILAAVGAEYSLSKQTSIYAQIGYVDNHGVMDTGLSITGALHLPTGRTIGANAGIRHTF